MLPAFKDEYLIENFKALIERHNIARLFETGTWKGISCAIASLYVDEVHTVEINSSFFQEAVQRNQHNKKVSLYFGNSPIIMNEVLDKNDEGWIFFLDAHWRDDWPLLDELRVIASKSIRPVIMIHDFYVPDGKGGAKFRHDSYKGQPLNFDYVKNSLESVYGEDGFTYYYSDKVGCVDSALLYVEPAIIKP